MENNTFYENDDISRPSPNRKVTMSVKDPKARVPKRHNDDHNC